MGSTPGFGIDHLTVVPRDPRPDDDGDPSTADGVDAAHAADAPRAER